MTAHPGFRRTTPLVAASLAAGFAWLAMLAPAAGAQSSQAPAPQLEVTAADEVSLLVPTETKPLEQAPPPPGPLGKLGLLLGTLAMLAIAVAGITLTLRSLREDRRLRRRGQGHGPRTPRASTG